MIKERVKRIQSELSAGQALLVTADCNRFYFTGFASSAGSVFLCKEAAVFLIDFRYFEKAKATVDSCQVIQSPPAKLSELCQQYGIKELFIEADSTPVSRLAALRRDLSGLSVSDSNRFDGIIAEMRSIKTQAELPYIREAQRMTDETFSYILNHIQPGRTEKEIMLDMEFYMRRMGSEGVSFDFIVVSGKNSSLPHGVPTDKVVERGDFVTMDFGAVVGGYHSDMTRTVAVGEASDEMRLVYDTVLKAQLESEKVIRAGAVCQDVDKVARDIIDAAGYKGCFGHGLGHSVGVEIHENPAFSPRCETVLKPGMIMTVEPGIYLENKFGVRIEDMVYVTETGSLNLTASPKQLILL
ncbi:MAG: aminopeptidase P family protein [Ruminococcaceae bacterium]|nr:aminopeptidase P family protein [Oscillospiraceae bacterium]